MSLNADQLAQYRGCWPENECYHDCVEAAQHAIDERTNPDELQRAEAWAGTETWI